MPHPFRLFGPDHWASLLVTLGLSLAFYLRIRQRGWVTADHRRFERNLGAFMVAYEGFKFLVRPLFLGEPWQTVLPLHLCQLAVIVLGLMLMTRTYLYFEIAYFWGVGGGTMAILTPDLAYGFPDPQYLMHNLTHVLIYAGVIYGLTVFRFRPTWHSFGVSFGTAFLLMVLVFPLNYWLGHGANYLFLRYRPQAGSLLDFLPEPPWHIPYVVLIALVIYFLSFLPFLKTAMKPAHE